MKFYYWLIVMVIFIVNQSFPQFGYHSIYKDANDNIKLTNTSFINNSNTFFLSGENSELPSKIFFLSVDSTGQIIYSKKINSNDFMAHSKDMKASVSSIFLLGYIEIPVEFHPETFIAKISQDGTLNWFKYFRPFIDNIPTSFTILQDESILISGYLQEGSPVSNRIFLLKLNNSGNISLLKRIEIGAESAPYSLIKTSDWGYAVTGYMKQISAQPSQMFVMKLDSLLNIQFVKTFSNSNVLTGKSIKEMSNGDFIVATDMNTQNQANEIALIRMSSAGNIIWAKYIPGANDIDDSPSSLVLDENNNIYLTGITGDFTNTESNTAFLSKVDINGIPDWFVSYYDSTQADGLYNTAGRLIISSNNTGFTIAGSRSVTTGSGTLENLLLIHTDSLGNADCYYSTINVNFEDLLLNEADITPVESEFTAIINDLSPPFSDYSLIQEYPCEVPVELTTFTANQKDHQIMLSWITASENNNRGFEIEKKAGSEENNWMNIGFVPGSGTSTEYNKYRFYDKNLTGNKSYYRLKQIDYDGTFKYSKTAQVDISLPNKFALYQNYPNPFNPVTNIDYAIPHSTFVTLKVYDALGNEIKTLVNKEMSAGNYSISFEELNLASGIYFYVLRSGDFIQSRKMVILK